MWMVIINCTSRHNIKKLVSQFPFLKVSDRFLLYTKIAAIVTSFLIIAEIVYRVIYIEILKNLEKSKVIQHYVTFFFELYFVFLCFVINYFVSREVKICKLLESLRDSFI